MTAGVQLTPEVTDLPPAVRRADGAIELEPLKQWLLQNSSAAVSFSPVIGKSGASSMCEDARNFLHGRDYMLLGSGAPFLQLDNAETFSNGIIQRISLLPLRPRRPGALLRLFRGSRSPRLRAVFLPAHSHHPAGVQPGGSQGRHRHHQLHRHWCGVGILMKPFECYTILIGISNFIEIGAACVVS